jgi:hypothetical protein
MKSRSRTEASLWGSDKQQQSNLLSEAGPGSH